MWLNYKTKPHLVEIFSEVYISEMMMSGVCFKTLQGEKGRWVDE